MKNKDINRVITYLWENTATSNPKDKQRLANLLKKIKFRKISAKKVKKLIADKMNNRKERVSVKLGECDDQYERIEIKYPKSKDHISLNPIQKLLRDQRFYVAQIIDFYEDKKRVVLLIREP